MDRVLLGLLALLIILIGLQFLMGKGKEIKVVSKEEKIVPFLSKDEFIAYLQEASELEYYEVGMVRAIAGAAPTAPEKTIEYSTTNVRTIGIDEPDILKTDGKRIYYSLSKWKCREFCKYINKIVVFNAYPPEKLNKSLEIDESGNLLVINGKIIVIKWNEIKAYDLNGSLIWEKDIDDRIVSARLFNNKIYLLVQTYIDFNEPCPIRPLSGISIGCSRIFHPTFIIPAESIYTFLIINPEDGKVEKSVSFIGSWRTVLYMSYKNAYIVYNKRRSYYELFVEYIKERYDELPEEAKEILGYKITDRSKAYEIMRILAMKGMLEDFKKGFEEYLKENKRKMETSVIVKISLDDFKIKAVGEVPGRILNEFSIDEYNNALRIATTVGWWEESENNVYILDEDLNIVKSLEGFERGERIYAVRFIGDLGYIVTFRETDPLLVIDLKDLKIKGKLKIPGYSSYLHPINETHLIGIGKNGTKVKISLFDVSDPENPKEVDRLVIDEYWSEVLRNHRAFLLDKRYKIFFIPGGKEGYVIRYDGKLEIVIEEEAKRACYIGKYLYLVSDDGIKVYNEENFEKVKEIQI